MDKVVTVSVNKSKWGEGPWKDEPDKVEWRDDTTGLLCLALRNEHMGFWCGYVGVDAENPAYERHYDDVEDVHVHGGLTFSGRREEGPKDLWWLGFDCGHYMDAQPAIRYRHPDLTGPLDGHYRTLAYVQRECARLAAQLV